MNEVIAIMLAALSIAAFFTWAFIYPKNKLMAGIMIMLMGIALAPTAGLEFSENIKINTDGVVEQVNYDYSIVSPAGEYMIWAFATLILAIGLIIVLWELAAIIRKRTKEMSKT